MRPFRDVDAGEKTFRHPHTKGFGIGLAIAGALAREIGAILSVTAPPEGGIRVIVTMPRTSGEP
jgi:signal transduction histidine kinase